MSTTASKREMIQWLLDFYPHENKEVTNFFLFLLDNQALLKYIEFTDQVIFAPRGVWINYSSTYPADQSAAKAFEDSNPFNYYKSNSKPKQDQVKAGAEFKYYKDQACYLMIEQAFHDFRLNALREKQIFYLELNFPQYLYEILYRDLLVENPYVPLHMKAIDQISIFTQGVSKEAHKMIVKSYMDQALDEGDYEKLTDYLDKFDSYWSD